MNNLILALEITVVGMGLVFAALILIWWMMALLTRLTAEKEAPAGEPASAAPETNERAEAAALAVAIAMAEHQLSQKGTPIVRNPRKIG